ncbi:YbaN family protein [Shewanella vesiculosa]|nr:YbaN family protein [Shewanella vesiculosa]UJL43968.1 YbaN family protein [Shewanella vesiculosa]
MAVKRGFFLIIIGLCSLVLGLIGIVLPLLPTVPFILLAAFCFSRSNDRLHHWLVNHPWFAEGIRQWQSNRALSRPLKKKAMLMSVLSFGVSIAIVPIVWVKMMLLCMMLFLVFFLWRIPELE